jgi:hypothetical protein
MLAGFFTTDLNAQSCCTPKKECKPAVCCPTTPTCCKATKGMDDSVKKTVVKNVISQQKNSTSLKQLSQPIEKEDELVVAKKVE